MTHSRLGLVSGRHASAPTEAASKRFDATPRLAYGVQPRDDTHSRLRPRTILDAVCSTGAPLTLPKRPTPSSRRPLVPVVTKVRGAVHPDRELLTSTGHSRRRFVLPPVSQTRRNDALPAVAAERFTYAEPSQHRRASGIIAGGARTTTCPTKYLRGDLQPLSDRGTNDLISTFHRDHAVDKFPPSGRPALPIASMSRRPITAGQSETARPVESELRLPVHSKNCRASCGRSNTPHSKAQKRWGRVFGKMGPVCRADGTGIPRFACHAQTGCRGGPRR